MAEALLEFQKLSNQLVLKCAGLDENTHFQVLEIMDGPATSTPPPFKSNPLRHMESQTSFVFPAAENNLKT